ncbi:MAG: hypothetical protein IKU25_06540 [Clostridia bacterium]|nr:hypothetical protein [Clostridia bacterium]
MRNLTIKRNKSFVGCANKVKIYIEDNTSDEIVIGGVPCRKLGELKNGKEATFQIDYAERKVFVIVDKLTKDYCNDYYIVPEGYEDVYVTGQNRLDPVKGNAFLFDVVSDEKVLEARKKGTKKGIIITIICVVIGCLIGLLPTIFSRNMEVESKTFSSNGLTITLTNEFKESEAEGYDVCLLSKKISLCAFKEGFYDYGDDMSDVSLEEYAQLLIEANDLQLITSVQTVDDLTYFEYDAKEESGITYTYFVVVYKSDNAFWMLSFSTSRNKAQEFRPDMIEWAKSVKF